jgi:hypothetical protein
MLLPQIDVGYMGSPLLYVLNNCLCVFFETSKTHWALWSMKEYGVFESWTKLMIIPHQTLTKYLEFSYIHPLFFSENGIVLLVYSRSYKIGLYNFSSGGSDFDYPSVSSKLGIDRHIYHESLVSPQRWITFVESSKFYLNDFWLKEVYLLLRIFFWANI